MTTSHVHPHRRLRLGMVGGGEGAFIGSVHRIAARLDDCFELVAGCLSSQPARAAASAAGVRIAPERSYATYAEMARAEAARADGIDVVAIVTPNDLHAPVASAFLQSGIHVICDKPLAITLAEGEALSALAKAHQRVFALTHVYSAYPMVRHARAMVAAGEIGEVRLVHVEYAQDWLAEAATQSDDYQRNNWHNDPLRAGATGCLADIGTHAYHLAGFVTGMQPNAVLGELHAFTPGRRLDDHVQVMLRYANGARGMLWSSQMATGCENGLRLRVFGSKASLAFDQEQPNELLLTPQGGNLQRLSRGRVHSAAAQCATRTPSGHPEGFLEAFATLYRETALHITGADTHPDAGQFAVPDVDDGVAGLRFIDAVLASHRQNGVWVDLPE